MTGEPSPLLPEDKSLTGRLDISFALTAAGLGVWELDPATRLVNWDNRCRELYGLARANPLPYEQAIRHIHPDDVNRVDAAVTWAMNPQSGGTYDVTYRTIGAEDRMLRWVRFMGRSYFDASGAVYRFAGVAQEVTQLAEAKQRAKDELTRFKYMADNASDPFILMRADGTFAYLNQLALDRWGYTAGEARQIRVPDVDPIYNETVFGDAFARAQAEKIPPFETLHRRKDGTIYPVEVNMGGLLLGGEPHLFAVARDITERKKAEQALQDSETHFRNVTNSSPTGLWLSDETGGLTYLNKTLVDWTGLPYHSLLGTGWASAIIDDDRQQSADVFLSAVTTRTHYEVLFRIRKKDGTIMWCQAAGDPYYRTDGSYAGYAGFCMDIDELVNKREAVQQSEAKLRSLITNAPASIGLYVGRDLVIDTPNQMFIDIMGKGPAIAGKPLREVMPELEGQPFLQLLDEVYTSGQMYQSYGAEVMIMQQGVPARNFYNLTYSPLLDAAGAIYAILEIAIDVTGEIMARRELEESELFSRSIFYNSPVANVVFVGEAMVVRTINENMLTMLGRDSSIVGRPFMEAIPELVPTPLMDRLRHVLVTGETYYQPEEKIDLVKQGQPHTGYYNYIYKALQNTAGENYGIIVTATEVTEQVLARQKVEAAEMALRGAVELAELATWSLDIGSGLFTYSTRFMNWLGFADDTKSLDEAYNPLPDEYRQSVAEAIAAVIRPGSTGVYENEHPVINRLTGQKRIIHAQAQLTCDADGQPLTLSGTARDVTQQRQLQLALEQQVQERTEELAASNEEMAAINEEMTATNEELATTNEELTESNQLLIRSNENLQQFAYVASHDLQEPLRKIQSFGDLLKTRYASQLGDGVDHLERMQVAASRMSSLIRDLLTFSRISVQQDTSDVVALSQVVGTVLNDLDMRIRETSAVVDVDALPAVRGDATQLEQLFQNLLSNALKFRRKGAGGEPVAPHIRVRCQTIAAADLAPSVRPAHGAAAYYRIDVADNGIGFEEKYVDRIFQVFQRLHGKAEFDGTGIGLAICAKVAANHGGAITAHSQPGQGATFSLYLPR